MDFSVITINYNSSHKTIDFIKSILLYSNKNLNFEIIVVDNNSSVNDYKNLKQELAKTPFVRIVRSKINLGFGSGNMFGFQFAKKSDFVVFVNNDVLFKEDTFGILYAYIKNNPNVGLCSGLVEHSNSKEKVHSFNHFHNLWMNLMGTKLYEIVFRKNKIHQAQKDPIKVDFVIGSFMFFRTSVFAEVGGFDLNIFLYYEEMDICFRIKKNSFETHLVPKTTYVHDCGYTTNNTNKNIDLLKEQQIVYHYVFKKCYGMRSYVLLYFLVLIKHCFKAILKPNIYLPLLLLHLNFNPMHKSLRHKQKITILDEV